MESSGCLTIFLHVLFFIWDFVTYPIYFLIQQPWRQTQKIKKTRARIVTNQAKEVTIRAVPFTIKIKEELKACPEAITTMEKLWNFSMMKFGTKRALGSREVLGEVEEKQSTGKMFTKFQLGDYSWISYQDLNTRADNLGRGFRELGAEPRGKVVVYANTCAEWMTSAIAAFKHSLAVVTIYTNLGEEGVEHGVAQTDAAIIVASQDLVPRLTKVLPRCPSVRHVIIIPGHKPGTTPDPVGEVTFHKFEDVMRLGTTSSAAAAPPGPSDPAIIMYTSGSTGVPKGVVLSHGNLVQALHCIIPTACDALGISAAPAPDDCYIAILPLAHVLELLAENIMLVVGIPIGYSSPTTFIDTSTAVARGSKGDASVLRPTVVCVVPTILNRIHKGIKARLAARGPFFSNLVELCYEYRLKWTRRGHDTPVMNRLIFTKFRAIIGGNIRVLLSGGAPLAADAHDFVRTCLGITLLQARITL